MNTLPWHTLPRTTLGHYPTPLEPLDRLSHELGGPRIWVKRDDCTGLATGGNKTRKLELLIGDALEQGADTLITFGAVQSNHARQAAAACAKAGLACHLILTKRVSRNNPNYGDGGNVLLGRLLGARQHIIESDQAKDYFKDLQKSLTASGKKTYVVPAGGSNALGALGYASCAEELTQQCDALGISPGHMVHASASAGTQAGLLAGLEQVGLDCHVLGINVYHDDPSKLESRIRELLAEIYASFIEGKKAPFEKIDVNHAYFGEGYGQPTEQCLEAIKTLAELEGLLFDPVYSGKALAAMIDQVTLGNFRDSNDVILIHTGGTPALNVYAEAFV